MPIAPVPARTAYCRQGLYLAAREELARLDKENTELKDMIQGQVFELTHSR